MRILYVEDNQANLFLIQRVARMGNHEVMYYENGEGALDNFERDRPDLVLMDVQLSGSLTGLDVVRVLRERGVTTPIIAVTAYAMVGDRERCIEAGCDGYLSKPLPIAELVDLIRKYETRIHFKTSTEEMRAVRANSPAAAAPTEIPTEPTPSVPLPAADSQPTSITPPQPSANGSVAGV